MFLVLPFFCALFIFCSCIIATDLQATSTSSHGSSIYPRADSLPTLTLGDVGQYAVYTETKKVEPRSIAIYPTGIHSVIPEEGIFVAFGSVVQKKIPTTITDKCKDPKNLNECQRDITRILQESSLTTHAKRFLPLIAAATVAEILQAAVSAIVVAVGIGTIGMSASNLVPAGVRLESGIGGPLEQIPAMTEASEIAVATGNENKIMATITVDLVPPEATHKPEDSVRIEEVTSDSGDNKKGDLLIYVPRNSTFRLEDFLGMMGAEGARRTCEKHQKRKKRLYPLRRRKPPTNELSPECEEMLSTLSRTVFEAMSHELDDLVPASLDNPLNPANNPEGALIPNIMNEGVPVVIPLVRTGRGDFNRRMVVGSLATTFVINRVIQHTAEIVDDLVIKLSREETTRMRQDDAQCPRDLICLDEKCKGYFDVKPTIPIFEAGKRVQTDTCTVKEVRGCACQEVIFPIRHMVQDGYLEGLQAWIAELDESTKGPQCDSENKVSADRETFEKTMESACQEHNELRRRAYNRIFKRDSWEWTNQDDTSSSLSWKFYWNDQGEKCPLNCKDIFDKIRSSGNCVVDHQVSRKGSISTDCGDAGFSVEKRKPSPPAFPPPPHPEKPLPSEWGAYLLSMVQEIPKSGEPKLWWELYADPEHSYVQIHEPSDNADIDGATYLIHIIVDDPRDKDKTRVHFTIAKPEDKKYIDVPWALGPKKKDGWGRIGNINWCAVDEDWKDENDVWRRRMRCHFIKRFDKAHVKCCH
ncbi:hypothetical protein BU24DRAFT_470162 [Aaosphaeria arxii CBS 175.79]|uniref:Uncharacterized protein n=1 Tax=Aaosphaeria arxii CBS 175.79 TaxID=1450172 RepID=A0A6A5Y7V7_9PLEO|nr:uncharacterized protein BU24DRAFT_470162 [Aaosphaeria arxii CBS 175.79]KAF2021389.1 hypothetical protein BU24DRAFT_470162 [Aaosphaeria arxii CBS 175.79]